MRLRHLVPLAAVLAVGVTPAAHALVNNLFGRAPAVKVDVTGVESQAQLARTLGQMGYADIRLSPIYPSPVIPYPENDSYWASRLDKEPVHDGWNGSAVKDGQWVRVWVDLH